MDSKLTYRTTKAGFLGGAVLVFAIAVIARIVRGKHG